jgi:hypothetical protein
VRVKDWVAGVELGHAVGENRIEAGLCDSVQCKAASAGPAPPTQASTNKTAADIQRAIFSPTDKVLAR